MQETQETRIQFLGQEDPLEEIFDLLSFEEMATQSSILAWEIPWTEESWWATVHEVAKSRTRLRDGRAYLEYQHSDQNRNISSTRQLPECPFLSQ